MPSVLSGVTVVDFSRAIAGPYCAMLLGDLGANVIKVETPGVGDESRQYSPRYGEDSCYYLVTNRNKRSVTLDLKSAAAAAVLPRLIGKADVLIENFRPQAAQRLGLTYEALHGRYPRLIHCSITGFGPSGPMSDRPAMDALIQAYVGAMSINGEADGPPARMGLAVADLGTALFATYGIQAALAARQMTGRGQRVETSLMESLSALLCYHNAIFWGTGEPPRRMGSGHPAFAPLQVYPVADGHLFIMAGNQKQWTALCSAIGKPELATDRRFRSNIDRVQNKASLNAILEAVFIQRTRAEWQSRLLATDVLVAPVNDIDDILSEPQMHHRDMVVPRPHPSLGTMNHTGFPVKLSETPATFGADPPRVGQHTEEVLLELGFPPEEIASLRQTAAI